MNRKLSHSGAETFRWENDETLYVVKDIYRGTDFSRWCQMAERVVNKIRQIDEEDGECEFDPLSVISGELYLHYRETLPTQLNLLLKNLLDAVLLQVNWREIATFLTEASRKNSAVYSEGIRGLEYFEAKQADRCTNVR